MELPIGTPSNSSDKAVFSFYRLNPNIIIKWATFREALFSPNSMQESNFYIEGLGLVSVSYFRLELWIYFSFVCLEVSHINVIAMRNLVSSHLASTDSEYRVSHLHLIFLVYSYV